MGEDWREGQDGLIGHCKGLEPGVCLTCTLKPTEGFQKNTNIESHPSQTDQILGWDQAQCGMKLPGGPPWGALAKHWAGQWGDTDEF